MVQTRQEAIYFQARPGGVLRDKWKDAGLSEIDIHFPESLYESREDI